MPVKEFLRYLHHSGLAWASELRATREGLVQLIYLRGQGSQLVQWPFG
jgi:hypothetical protein